jgi:NitT/TauT family transport system permease protein
VLPLLTIALLFLLWEAACAAFAIPAYIFPAPSAIWVESSALSRDIAWHTLVTGKTVLLGFLACLLVSLPLAVILTSSPILAAAVYPLLVLTQAIPKVALAPILVVVLGTSELPRVVVTFLVAFFPLVLSIAAGLVSPARPAAGPSCGAYGFPSPCRSSSAGSRPRSPLPWSARWWRSSSTPMPASAI